MSILSYNDTLILVFTIFPFMFSSKWMIFYLIFMFILLFLSKNTSSSSLSFINSFFFTILCVLYSFQKRIFIKAFQGTCWMVYLMREVSILFVFCFFIVINNISVNVIIVEFYCSWCVYSHQNCALLHSTIENYN